MVTVIRQPSRGPSTGERLSAGIGSALQLGQQFMQERERAIAERQQQQQLESAYQQLGIPPGTPPELAKIHLAEKLRGQRPEKPLTSLQQSQQALNEEKLKALQGQEDLFSKLAGGKPIASQPGQETGVQPQADISNTDESLLRQVASFKGQPGKPGILGNMAQAELDRRKEEKKFEEEKRKTTPEFKREEAVTKAQASADIKYNQDLQAAHKQHQIKSQALNRLEELNKKGVTGKPYEKLLEKFGLVSLTSEGRREFAAEVKNLITDIRSILGSQFSQFEFSTILNAYPSADFSKEANSAIIRNLKEFQDIRNQEFEIANDIKRENKGKIPKDYQAQVNDRLQEYAQSRLPEIKRNTQEIMRDEYRIPPGHILMLAPDGEPLSVPADAIQKYSELGASFP